MSEHLSINLLIVDRSASDIECIVQALRDAGYLAQPLRADKETDIHDIIQYKPLDMIMARQGEDLPSIETLRDQVSSSNHDIPILALVDEHMPLPSVELLRAGADNLCNVNEPEHIGLTAAKELHHLNLRRQMRSLETRLGEMDTRNQILMESSRDAIAYIHEGVHIYANPAYLNLFGYADKQELEGTTLIDMFVREDQDKLKRFLRRSIKEGKPLDPIQLIVRHKSGNTFPVELGCMSTRMDNEPCLQIMIRTPAHKPDPEPGQAKFNTHDVYTGLYNRKFFTHLLDERCRNPKKSGGAVLYILLTSYRSISEQLGLEAVDQLTVDLADLLQKLVSKDDVVARFSDAVFLVYTPKSSRESVLRLGELISRSIKDHVSHAAQKLITTASATGICLIQDQHEHASRILAHADRACEAARQLGANHVQIYNPRQDRNEVQIREEELVELIRDAISGERLDLLYQPIASFQGGANERYKVELQILDRDQEPLSMPILEPVAEHRGLMFPLDKWIIGRGLERIAERYRLGKSPPTLFIPISGNSVKEGGFCEWLSHRLVDTGLSGEFLVIEIKEEHAERYFKESKNLRDRLRDLKCGFALFKFGGKDNSERILEHLMPDYIKLDSALIEKLSKTKDAASTEAMKALTEKAREMNTTVIAEDISSAPEMASIWQYGVTLVQGNMVQEPSPDMKFDFQMFAG